LNFATTKYRNDCLGVLVDDNAEVCKKILYLYRCYEP